MERAEVSRHEVDVYRAILTASPAWLTSKEIAERAEVSARTARAHALRMTRMGLVEQAEVFPGFRYRLVDQRYLNEGGSDYAARLVHAASALGIELEPA